MNNVIFIMQLSPFKGNRNRFELSRVKLVRKWADGELKQLRVVGRFELSGEGKISKKTTWWGIEKASSYREVRVIEGKITVVRKWPDGELKKLC